MCNGTMLLRHTRKHTRTLMFKFRCISTDSGIYKHPPTPLYNAYPFYKCSHIIALTHEQSCSPVCPQSCVIYSAVACCDLIASCQLLHPHGGHPLHSVGFKDKHLHNIVLIIPLSNIVPIIIQPDNACYYRINIYLYPLNL